MMELDPESRRILDLARSARTPSAADKARVERRFTLALGLSAGSASAAASAQTASHLTASKSAASAVVLKWWAGSGAVLAAAVASYAALGPTAAPRPVATPPAAAAQIANVPAQTTLAAQPQPTAAEPVVSAREQPAPAARQVESRRAAEPRPSLAAELELLHRAQAAWRAREAARALAIVDEHRTRYPRSELRLEREALQVLALCELGRKRDAARVARALLTRDPNSPLRASIEQSCALK